MLDVGEFATRMVACAALMVVNTAMAIALHLGMERMEISLNCLIKPSNEADLLQRLQKEYPGQLQVSVRELTQNPIG
jgi:hypothetical protein